MTESQVPNSTIINSAANDSAAAETRLNPFIEIAQTAILESFDAEAHCYMYEGKHILLVPTKHTMAEVIAELRGFCPGLENNNKDDMPYVHECLAALGFTAYDDNAGVPALHEAVAHTTLRYSYEGFNGECELVILPSGISGLVAQWLVKEEELAKQYCAYENAANDAAALAHERDGLQRKYAVLEDEVFMNAKELSMKSTMIDKVCRDRKIYKRILFATWIGIVLAIVFIKLF